MSDCCISETGPVTSDSEPVAIRYCCDDCGCQTWRSETSLEAHRKAVYECPGCGADLKYPGGDRR
ncbi:hypothetical protein [Natronosalvus amylolyticus]|uniref:hypothetical protein n=1 Tax=Natronosalvus amylolyticus TaxID=2961994 RepID=UPI0020C9E2B8|nr:hypothetical protein [Natronosalvus amylolyticus]